MTLGHLARRVGPPVVLMGVLLAVWEGYVGLEGVAPSILPAPSRVGVAGVANAGLLGWHAAQTLAETLLGLTVAVVLACVCAVAVDRAVTVRRLLLPLLVVSQAIPIVAVAPLMVLWFGFGVLPKVLVVVLVCFFPLAVASAQGLRSLDEDVLRLYRTFGASYGQVLRRVKVPHALPTFFTGLRISATYAVIAAIFGEYVGAARGLGILLQTARNAYRTDLVFAAITVAALLSLLLYGLVVVLERRLVPWVRYGEGRAGSGER